MLTSTAIAFVAIALEATVIIIGNKYLCLLDSSISSKANIFSFDQPRRG